MVSEKESKMEIKEFLKSKIPEVEKNIENFIPRTSTKKWIESALGKTIFELDLEAYNKGVNEPIWELLDRGGKRFRPIMTCLVAEAVGGKFEEAMKLAPMVEIIHNGCVEENTIVWMANGTPKKMKDVQIGEYVLSVDKHGRLKERRVMHKHDNGVKKVLAVKTNNRTVSATEEHPFLTVGKTCPENGSVGAGFKWVRIKNLKKGDVLVITESACANTVTLQTDNVQFQKIKQISAPQLGFVEVREVIEEANPVQTYDIEVEETHSYIANGIVVHNTLMQDDVEDDSQARRGKLCTHKVYGVDTAVNTGTIMYFWPMVKILTDEFKLGDEKRLQIYDIFIRELLRVCSGQAWDIAWHHGGFTPNEAQYLNMCLSKTGVLTRFACQLGAISGNATKEQLEALGDFGQIVGVGFQIQDDILELTEDKFKEGKGSVGGDIHEGKRTLIIIRTLEKASAKDKKRLIEILDSHTLDSGVIQEALDIINKYDGIAYSKKKAEELVLGAWAKADKVLKESNAKKLLKKFAEYLVDRKI